MPGIIPSPASPLSAYAYTPAFVPYLRLQCLCKPCKLWCRVKGSPKKLHLQDRKGTGPGFLPYPTQLALTRIVSPVIEMLTTRQVDVTLVELSPRDPQTNAAKVKVMEGGQVGYGKVAEARPALVTSTSNPTFAEIGNGPYGVFTSSPCDTSEDCH